MKHFLFEHLHGRVLVVLTAGRVAHTARRRTRGAKWPELYERFLPGWKELNPVTRNDAEDGFRRKVNKYLQSHLGCVDAGSFRSKSAGFGWRGLGEAALACAVGLLAYHCFFSSWNKLLFACSHLPGKTPGWIRAFQFFGVVTLVPVLNAAFLATLYHGLVFVPVLAALIAAWTRAHALRREGWSDLRLKYEELPDPAVHGLNLRR